MKRNEKEWKEKNFLYWNCGRQFKWYWQTYYIRGSEKNFGNPTFYRINTDLCGRLYSLPRFFAHGLATTFVLLVGRSPVPCTGRRRFQSVLFAVYKSVWKLCLLQGYYPRTCPYRRSTWLITLLLTAIFLIKVGQGRLWTSSPSVTTLSIVGKAFVRRHSTRHVGRWWH